MGACAATEQSHLYSVCPLPDTTSEVHELIGGLHDVMGHGAFQRRVLLFGILSTLVLLCHAFSYRLVARPVDHWCRPPNDLAGQLPGGAWKNVAIPLLADGSFSQCTVYDPPLPDLMNSTRKEVQCDAWQYDTASPQDSIVSQWDLVCGRAWMVPFSSAVYLSGAMMCVPVSGIVADRWGRKPVINAWVATLLVAGVGCVGASSYSLFVTSRFVVSAANSSITVVVLILLYEVTCKERRLLFVVVYASCGTVLLPVLYRLIELYHLNWRTIQMVLMLPTSLLVSCLYLLEESPSWLLASWKTRAAEQVVVLAAAVNGVPAQRASEAFHTLRERLERLDLARDRTFVLSPSTFVQEALLRWTTLPVELCWFTTFFGFYGINFRGVRVVASMAMEDELFVALQTPLAAAAYWSMRRAGVRATLCMLLCLTSASCAAYGIVSPMPAAVDVVREVRRVLVTLVLGPIYVHTAQMFPTQVCSMGISASYAIGQFGALGGSLLVHINEMTFDMFLGVTAFAAFCGVLSAPDSAPLMVAPKALRPLASPERPSALHHPGAEAANNIATAETTQQRRKTSAVSFAATEDYDA
ncbi:solute carrier family 22 member 7-like [Dermacentor silvarum]|uniref:solute carrier family 22 member 7-like n=1 Tax=Dermacentor silvarum TaxID=543639 RepID=UPI001899EA15|nr:solute carrier family 22 member 7-like [Dermacentor silvarum]